MTEYKNRFLLLIEYLSFIMWTGATIFTIIVLFKKGTTIKEIFTLEFWPLWTWILGFITLEKIIQVANTIEE